MPDYVSWIIFAVIVGGLLFVDLFVFHRDVEKARTRLSNGDTAGQ